MPAAFVNNQSNSGGERQTDGSTEEYEAEGVRETEEGRSGTRSNLFS